MSSNTLDTRTNLANAIAASKNPREQREVVMSAVGLNPLFNADMYKVTHHSQLPPDTEYIQSYFEARAGAALENVVVFGLQFLIHEIAAVRITKANVEEAEKVFNATFPSQVFNKKGWMAIVDAGGHLPVRIRALPEGKVVRPGIPHFVVETTNPDVPWIGNWLETWLMHNWYTVTVATIAFHQRQTLESYLVTEGIDDAEVVKFSKTAFVDFGMRGATTMQAAARGGAAVMTSFNSSDNALAGIQFAESYNADDMNSVFSSIPAAEHMTVTIYGEEGEELAYKAILASTPGPISVVSDSYNYKEAVKKLWCGSLRDVVKARYEKSIDDGAIPAVLVIRPDSGDMIENILFTLDMLAKAYGVTGDEFRKVHDCVRIIQGDNITMETYETLLSALHKAKWSVTNIAVGSGGGLLQKVNRDTLKCAIKASLATVGGIERQICKKTPGKESKRGRITVECEEDTFVVKQEGKGDPDKDVLSVVYEDGKAIGCNSVKSVRNNVDSALRNLRDAKRRRLSYAADAAALKEDDAATGIVEVK